MNIIEAPITGEIKVQVTDGERVAWVTYSLPYGRYPTQDEIDKAIQQSIETAQDQMGENWNIPNPQEFMENVLEEVYGQKVAMPNKKEYDEPYTVEEKDEE